MNLMADHRRTFLALGLVFAVAAGGAGCEQQGQLRAGSGEPTTKPKGGTGGVDASLETISPEIQSLASQSQRDVDLILKSRSEANKRLQTELDAAPPALAAPQRMIVWNDPNAPGAQPHGESKGAKSTAGSVLPPAPPTTVAEKPAASSATGSGSASPTLEPDRLKSLMVDLTRELYASGSYSATPLRELLTIAAMSMFDPARQLDPQAIPDLTEKERELLGKLQTFFAELGKSLGGDGKATGKDTEQVIVDAIAKLREGLVKQPILRLATATLCTRVGGFGDYTTFEKNSFLAQSQQKVIVYLEIADFTSELNQKSEYVTQIAQQLTIYNDRDGIPVWKEDWQSAIDVTKNKRQDFFTVQVITLPKALTVGKYQLKVRAKDEKSGAEAEASIPFEMVADPRLASK